MQYIKQKLAKGNIGLIILIIVLFIAVVGVVGARVWYSHNLGPVSSDTKVQYFTVSSGTSVHQIAAGLYKAHLIKNAGSFETYVRGRGYSNKLQAGTYSLSPSMGVAEISKKMVNGDVAKNLLTILPGKRLDQIMESFIKSGYTSSQVTAAFNPQ